MNRELAKGGEAVLPDPLSGSGLQELRTEMMRFATLQLRDNSAAEDAVQEALSAAIASSTKFQGRAQKRTWIFSILRNKVVDIIRDRNRRPTQSLFPDDSGEELDELFDENGNWKPENRPTDWGRPENIVSNGQFLEIFEACVNHLPENTARIFMMREVLGLDISEICGDLSITEGNCWVILHRARSRLRRCLEKNWINEGDINVNL